MDETRIYQKAVFPHLTRFSMTSCRVFFLLRQSWRHILVRDTSTGSEVECLLRVWFFFSLKLLCKTSQVTFLTKMRRENWCIFFRCTLCFSYSSCLEKFLLLFRKTRFLHRWLTSTRWATLARQQSKQVPSLLGDTETRPSSSFLFWFLPSLPWGKKSMRPKICSTKECYTHSKFLCQEKRHFQKKNRIHPNFSCEESCEARGVISRFLLKTLSSLIPLFSL